MAEKALKKRPDAGGPLTGAPDKNAPAPGACRPERPENPGDPEKAEAFEKKVLEHCLRQGLFRPQGRVIAAVSGGADSMALLVFLLRSAQKLGITVGAVHVDHGIRGAASAADAAFVADFCAAHGVPLHRFSAAQAGIALPEHPSEDWARQLRYGFFAQLLQDGDDAAQRTTGGRVGSEADKGPSFGFAERPAPIAGAAEGGLAPAVCRPPCIATAHTLNDQAETLLFRLARGCGLHGAGGIRPVRGSFVRPLLAVSRDEVEEYCAALSIPYVQDETNFQPLYARSRLRAGALPALCSVNGAALSHLAGFCEQMQRLDGYFAAKGETLLQTAADAAPVLPERRGRPDPAGLLAGPWSLAVLGAALKTDEPVLEAALIALMAQNLPGFSPEERIVRLAKELVGRGSGAVQLTAGAALTARRGALWLRAAHNVSGRKGKL